jgi:hypothetical protein
VGKEVREVVSKLEDQGLVEQPPLIRPPHQKVEMAEEPAVVEVVEEEVLEMVVIKAV